MTNIINIFQWDKKINKSLKKNWSEKRQFCQKINEIQEYFIVKNKYENICNDCVICHQKCIGQHIFTLYNYKWNDGICHYILKHGLKPPDEFIDKIFKYIIKDEPLPYRIKGKQHDNYVKIHRNQLLILDALMNQGGFKKKYIDIEKKQVHYSEHAGVLDFEKYGLSKIIVSGDISRIDKNDEEIFLPNDLPEMFTYEYIFHTHPPTPRPGGRAKQGILYELPSIGDIFHFIEHFNNGNCIGSIIMTPEGLYNIRKLENNNEKINIDENALFKKLQKTFENVHEESIEKYGTSFSIKMFYTIISQDLTFINVINECLRSFKLYIDFYPRINDGINWFVDSIHLRI